MSSPTADPSATSPAASPSQTAVPEALIEATIRFRALTGLRADEAWTRQVAADARHATTFGVPLLPEEEAELDARPRSFGEVAAVLQDYSAAHPGEYGGMYVDPPGSQQMVIMFTGHLEDHRSAIAKLVHPLASLQLRVTPIAERDLDALMARIDRDRPTLRAAGIAVVSIERDDVGRVVDVSLSTERVDAAGFLVGTYGPTVRASVLDPTGAVLKEPGTIVGRVADTSGKGLAAMVWGKPLFADFPMDLLPTETPLDGTFRMERCMPGRWGLTAESAGFAAGAVEVDVPVGGVVSVVITLTAAP